MDRRQSDDLGADDLAADDLEEVERRRRVGPVIALESTALPRRAADRSSPQGGSIAGPGTAVVEWREGRWSLRSGSEPFTAWVAGAPADPFRGLEYLLDHCAREFDPRARAVPEASRPWWALGFFGYEATAPSAVPCPVIPDAWFLLTDEVLPLRPRRPRQDPLATQRSTDLRRSEESSLFLAEDLDLESYAAVFERIRIELKEGNSYQLCYTYPLIREYRYDPLDLYRALSRINPAPFASFLDAGDFAIVSSSPERFLCCDRDGWVEARPMKGTAPRTGAVGTDRRVRRALSRSPKDRAENLMIADLLRNDLGRVCQLGSVQVAQQAQVEEYETVFQMVTAVEGRLEPGKSRSDLLHATFPPGSMIGAPKTRSMEILKELEAGPRGPYSGILGYWRSDGVMDFSVLIRSWVLQKGIARCGVGGGVVWDSKCENEYLESRLKAKAMLRAHAIASARSAVH